MGRKLTLEEQEELQQNLDMRKTISDEIITHLVHIRRLEETKDNLRKRYFEILDDAKRVS